jgi:hypothetical protein
MLNQVAWDEVDRNAPRCYSTLRTRLEAAYSRMVRAGRKEEANDIWWKFVRIVHPRYAGPTACERFGGDER